MGREPFHFQPGEADDWIVRLRWQWAVVALLGTCLLILAGWAVRWIVESLGRMLPHGA
jgi:hypothetical protein